MALKDVRVEQCLRSCGSEFQIPNSFIDAAANSSKDSTRLCLTRSTFLLALLLKLCTWSKRWQHHESGLVPNTHNLDFVVAAAVVVVVVVVLATCVVHKACAAQRTLQNKRAG